MQLLLFMTRGMSLTAWEKNGSLSRELALYEKMAEHGVRTSIISWGGKEEKILARRYPWLSVYANVFNLSAAQYERLMPLLHALPLVRADLIKCNQTNGGDLALRCARFWQKPFVSRCGYVWSIFAHTGEPECFEQIFRMEKKIFSDATFSIVTTQAASEYLSKSHNLSSDSIHCIPNYIPDVFFEIPLPNYKNSNPGLITSVSRLAPQKNLFALVEACVGLDVTLRIIGDGSEREALQTHAEKYQVRVEFIFSIAHDALPQILAESTVCALVSHYEGHPKALIEYMAAGCPVLASNVQGNNAVIEHMETGLMCGTDVQSIREGLKILLDDAPLRERLGKNAREAARKYALEEITEKELVLYGQIPMTSPMQKAASVLRLMVQAPFKFFSCLFALMRRLYSRLRGGLLNYVQMRLQHWPMRVIRFVVSRKKSDEAFHYLFELKAQICLLEEVSVVAYERSIHGEKCYGLCNASKAFEEVPKNEHAFCFDILNRIQEFADMGTHEDVLRALFFLEQQTYPLQGRLSVAYDGGIHTKHRHTKYHDFFIDRIRNGERVLDIGCGNGFLAWDIALKCQAVVTGIELSEENIAVARARFTHPNVTYIQGNALTDIRGGIYDTVILSNVLEHLPGRVAFLTGLRKKLKPRRFLCRVPLFERDWRVPLKKELGLDWRLDPTHETEYTYEDFVCELGRAGLAITSKEFRWGEIWCEASDMIHYAVAIPPEPVITVLMATHNDEAYVAEAIASILRQTERNFIFLIIDDASTDDTGKRLQEFALRDARIRVLKSSSHQGLTASLNRGLALVNTPYIARMDADDLALPERFERQLAYMEAHPAFAAVGSRILFFDGSNSDNPPWAWTMPTSPVLIREQTLSMAPQISHPSSFIRTSALKEVGGYREQFEAAQDYDLWLRLVEKFELGNTPEMLLLYRWHESSVSSVKVLEQAVNHVLAMRSSEFRRQGMADPLATKELGLPLLFDLLDWSQPSFWAWIRLLAQRPVPRKADLLLRTLYLVPCLEDAPWGGFMAPSDWAAIHTTLASAAELTDELQYRELCEITQTLSSRNCDVGKNLR